MGFDTLEHLVVCLCFAELHGWLYHMGESPRYTLLGFSSVKLDY
jgi:hypothetical protein